MVGLFENPELKLRKQVLAAESEIYRQTLKLEVYNLRLYSVGARRRLSIVNKVKPVLVLLAPLFALAARRRKEPRPRTWFGKAILGWRFYKRFAPVLQVLLAQRVLRRSFSAKKTG